ncbi:hypothetical protein CRG98_010649 [Punica granatum]|uniref:Uncharacterized protein n=1 Tax=Punica granatum TaxID=22663 RepID=A0A2I0KKK4_PUNGR|nr:hypothetical protein CRG98_010649 [Punica granatum]
MYAEEAEKTRSSPVRCSEKYRFCVMRVSYNRRISRTRRNLSATKDDESAHWNQCQTVRLGGDVLMTWASALSMRFEQVNKIEPEPTKNVPQWSRQTVWTRMWFSSGPACALLDHSAWECPPSRGCVTDTSEKESPLPAYPKVEGRRVAQV